MAIMYKTINTIIIMITIIQNQQKQKEIQYNNNIITKLSQLPNIFMIKLVKINVLKLGTT